MKSNLLLIGLGMAAAVLGWFYLQRRPGLNAAGGTGQDRDADSPLEPIIEAADGVFNAITGGKGDGCAERIQALTATMGQPFGLGTREDAREVEYQMDTITKKGRLARLHSFQGESFIPIEIHHLRPLKRRATLRLPGVTQLNGNPAVIAATSWAIQYLAMQDKERSLINWGCYENNSGWHGYGCAIDWNWEIGESLLSIHRQLQGLRIQWCDRENGYWISDPESSAGARRISNCSSGHDHHVHLEITPDITAWQFINHVNWEYK